MITDGRAVFLCQVILLSAKQPASARRTMLAEIALDPPTTSEDFAGEPHLDEDYLVQVRQEAKAMWA